MVSKKKKRRRSRSIPPQPPPEKKGCLGLISWWIVWLSTVVGGIVAIVEFWPRPEVTHTDSADPQSPFSVSFTISNNGLIPLSNVSAELAVRDITYDTITIRAYGTIPGDGKPAFFLSKQWGNHYLYRDNRFTISPDETDFGTFKAPNHGHLIGAHIGVTVNYSPWFIPKKMHKEFRYKAYRQTNGTISWFDEAEK
jgi:hypothetical protein